MYESESKWISQTLMTYRDEKYGSDGNLRISIYTGTKISEILIHQPSE